MEFLLITTHASGSVSSQVHQLLSRWI